MWSVRAQGRSSQSGAIASCTRLNTSDAPLRFAEAAGSRGGSEQDIKRKSASYDDDNRQHKRSKARSGTSQSSPAQVALPSIKRDQGRSGDKRSDPETASRDMDNLIDAMLV